MHPHNIPYTRLYNRYGRNVISLNTYKSLKKQISAALEIPLLRQVLLFIFDFVYISRSNTDNNCQWKQIHEFNTILYGSFSEQLNAGPLKHLIIMTVFIFYAVTVNSCCCRMIIYYIK